MNIRLLVLQQLVYAVTGAGGAAAEAEDIDSQFFDDNIFRLAFLVRPLGDLFHRIINTFFNLRFNARRTRRKGETGRLVLTQIFSTGPFGIDLYAFIVALLVLFNVFLQFDYIGKVVFIAVIFQVDARHAMGKALFLLGVLPVLTIGL